MDKPTSLSSSPHHVWSKIASHQRPVRPQRPWCKRPLRAHSHPYRIHTSLVPALILLLLLLCCGSSLHPRQAQTWSYTPFRHRVLFLIGYFLQEASCVRHSVDCWWWLVDRSGWIGPEWIVGWFEWGEESRGWFVICTGRVERRRGVDEVLLLLSFWWWGGGWVCRDGELRYGRWCGGVFGGELMPRLNDMR